ncbi:MAG: hypothetical protein ACE5H5_05235, partial [Nitrospinota bacterium]
MNLLYHNRDFIVFYFPPGPPRAVDVDSARGLLEGETRVRALATGAMQKASESGAGPEAFGPGMVVRSEKLGDGRTQLVALPVEQLTAISTLSGDVEYVCPYQAAVRAYVAHRLGESRTELDEKTAVAFVDVEQSHALITILNGGAVEIFRVVDAEELSTEFQRTADFYAHGHIDQALFLMTNSAEAARDLPASVGGLIGAHVVSEPCPALWALDALEVGPRFFLSELEEGENLAKERRRRAIRLAASASAAALAAAFALGSYLSY